MKHKFESGRHEDQWEFIHFFPGRWANEFTQSITVWITGVVTTVTAVVVMILVLVGGLWLAYVYLPANIFYIVLALIIADVALGIVLRSFLPRR
jgi:hypothetical protein